MVKNMLNSMVLRKSSSSTRTALQLCFDSSAKLTFAENYKIV